MLVLVYTPYNYHMFILELFKDKAQFTWSHWENEGPRVLSSRAPMPHGLVKRKFHLPSSSPISVGKPGADLWLTFLHANTEARKEERSASFTFANKSHLYLSPPTLSLRADFRLEEEGKWDKEGTGIPLKCSQGKRHQDRVLFFHLFIHFRKYVILSTLSQALWWVLGYSRGQDSQGFCC